MAEKDLLKRIEELEKENNKLRKENEKLKEELYSKVIISLRFRHGGEKTTNLC